MPQGTLQTDALGQNRPDLRTAVIFMDNDLHDDDIESMKFLCQGLVAGSKLKRIDMAHGLVSLLESAKCVSDTDFFILADLLQYIGRVDILEHIGFDEREVIFQRQLHHSKVKPFYVLLFQIAEELPPEDVRKASYMYGKVPRSHKLSSGIDLFSIMVQHQAVSPADVLLLKNIFTSIERQDIVEKIDKYCETAGASIIYDLEQIYNRSCALRGSDSEIVPLPVPGGIGGVHRGLGVSIDDHEVRDNRGNPSLPTPASDHTSMINHPPSTPRVAPSAPPPSLTQNQNLPPGNPASSVNSFSVPEGFDERILSRQVVDILARKIPAQYWPTFINFLGMHLNAQAWDVKNQNHSHNIVLLTRWLALPETREMGDVRARRMLVTALYHSGCTLMAEEIANLLNVNVSDILHDSMSTQASVYGTNEVASAGEAVQFSMDIQNQSELPNGASRQVVEPVTTHIGRLSLEPTISPIPHYTMNRIPRGFCVIINNRNFYAEAPHGKRMPDREGTDVDKEKLEDTFTKLNFIVRSHDNCTDTDMIQILNRYANEDNHHFDCFVCCILTHGTHGALYGCNGMTVPIRDLTYPFRSQQCPGLADKPKLFFMQACQGHLKQEVSSGDSDDVQRDAAVESDGPSELIPNESDFLLGYATVPGFVSYRSKTLGSWYITKLTELLNKYAFDHDILDILTLVNFEVGKGNAYIDGGHYKQSPAPMYSLRKKLIFGHSQH